MKTKILVIAGSLLLALGITSFKPFASANESKVVLITLLNGKGENEGFIISYGNGEVEKRPFDISMKMTEVINSTLDQHKRWAGILNEFYEKGYTIAAVDDFFSKTVILEKR